jgi:RepB DNA-primase from phage plasmid
VYQRITRPETLFRHAFGEDSGYLVTFTGQQARFTDPDARPNELADTRQLSWSYPEKVEEASTYLIDQAQQRRDAYFAVHLFQEPGNRRTANTVPTVRALWLDEDGGHFPEDGPRPTATVRSSRGRRHLYWRLSHAVSVEWAVATNRRLAAWAGGDTGKAGLSSVLRAPGTANFKRDPQVDLVVGESTGKRAWEPEVMDQAIPELPDPPRGAAKRKPYDGLDVDLAPYLKHVEVLGEVPDSAGVKFQITCPWLHQHSGGDRTGTYIGHRAGGGLWFCCRHQHCQHRTWREFKRAVFRNRRFTVGEDRPCYSGITVEVHYE